MRHASGQITRGVFGGKNIGRATAPDSRSPGGAAPNELPSEQEVSAYPVHAHAHGAGAVALAADGDIQFPILVRRSTQVENRSLESGFDSEDGRGWLNAHELIRRCAESRERRGRPRSDSPERDASAPIGDLAELHRRRLMDCRTRDTRSKSRLAPCSASPTRRPSSPCAPPCFDGFEDMRDFCRRPLRSSSAVCARRPGHDANFSCFL